MREYDNILVIWMPLVPPSVPGEVLAALVEMHNIASFLQLLGKEITLSACGDLPLALRQAVLDGLDGVMDNNVAQIGATSKSIEPDFLQPLGNINGLEGIEILKRVVLDFLDIMRENNADRVLAGRADSDFVLSDLHTVSDLNTIPKEFYTIIGNC